MMVQPTKKDLDYYETLQEEEGLEEQTSVADEKLFKEKDEDD